MREKGKRDRKKWVEVISLTVVSARMRLLA